VGGWVEENCGMKTEIEFLNQLVTSLERLVHGGSDDDVKIPNIVFLSMQEVGKYAGMLINRKGLWGVRSRYIRDCLAREFVASLKVVSGDTLRRRLWWLGARIIVTKAVGMPHRLVPIMQA
jgi:hypothetical protein